MATLSPDRIRGKIVRAKQSALTADAQAESSFWGVSSVISLLISCVRSGEECLTELRGFGVREIQASADKAKWLCLFRTI